MAKATPNLHLMNASWYFRFKLPGQPQQRRRIGRIEHISEAEARKQAAILYGQCLAGVDVIAATRASKVIPMAAPKPKLLSDAIDGFRDAFSPTWRPNSVNQYERGFRHMAPLADRPVAEIDVPAVISLLEPFWTSGRIPTGKLVQFNLKRIMDFAIAQRWVKGPNPAEWDLLKNVFRAAPQAQPRPALPAEALPALYSTLSTSTANADRVLAMLMLIPARSREVAELPWSELDIKNRCWNLPKERTKTKLDWKMPLAPQVIAFLGTPQEGRVFGGVGKGKAFRSTDMVIGHTFRRHVPAPATVHGLRSAFSSWAHAQKIDGHHRWSEKAVEGCMTHVYGSKMRRTYDRDSAYDERMDCLTAWAGFITGQPA